jgi:urease beta subunit
MKRLSLLTVMIIAMCVAFAGIDEYYTFNATNGTYTPIVGTDANISDDDALSAPIPIGFTFPYGNYTYTEVKISSNGWIGLGTFLTSTIPTNNLAALNYVTVVAPLWDDCGLEVGTCEYLLSGTASNRIFIVQYNNLQWKYNSSTYFNLQVRFYESGKIDFIYGPSTGAPHSPNASIGINMLPGGSGWFYSITPGSPATASTTTSNNSVATWPGEGIIYEFNPVVAVPNDLIALSITGNTIPIAEQSYDYTITIRNRGSNPQTSYQVKLLLGTQEIGSVNGTTIQPLEMLTYTIPWTPSTAGPATLYGKVVLTGDENSTNDQTPPLNVTVQPAGVQAVTIGAGNESARVPMDFYYENSLFECLFYPDELGFTNGTISSLAFYNNFRDSITNSATKIWLGTTTQADLSAGWIPSTQLTLVFDGNITYPSGENTITISLQTPYVYTLGNLVMMVQRPMDTQNYSSSDNFQAQTLGTSRARKVQSNSTAYDPANPPTNATVSGQFPKTTILYSGQAIVNDLACLSIYGNTFPSVGTSTPYTITVKNNGTAIQSNYTVKLMKEGGVLLGSVSGATINSLETLDFTINWTPTETGATYIYGEVEMTDDEIATNNQSLHINVEVQPAGVQAVTIGAGNALARVPMDFREKNSLFECLFYPDELGFTSGTITSLAFYNNFVTNLPNKPTKIWLGTTDQADLSAGWIPSTQLTLVFDGNITYPSGENIITIPLQTPYIHTPGNLVMMVQRPMDTQNYSSEDNFQAQIVGTNRALKFQDDLTFCDPANPPVDATVSGQFPKTTIFYSQLTIVNDLGCLSISGNTFPSVGTATPYIITVKNNGTVVQSNYTVKLMKEGGVLLGSVSGVTINSLQTLDFAFNWTPTETGATYIYGEVEMTDDEIATNNQSPHINVAVQPVGVQPVTIGLGDELALVPMDFLYMNSLFECLFYPDELGFTSGTITSLAFYNNFAHSPTNGATKIWLGTTNQADLSVGWIPSTQLTLVFDGNITYPVGANTIIIPLQNPYMHTPGNLVMMVQRPMDTQNYSYGEEFQAQTVGTSRARKVKSDDIAYDPANPPAEATVSGQFPKITIFYSGQAIVNDLGCLNISGNTTPNIGTATPYTITVKNLGTTVQSDYTVKLMKEGGVLLSSVPGVTINSLQTLDFTINWTPTETGATYIYGEVEMIGDEIAANNQSPHLNVNVYPVGTAAITVGTGNSTGRMPMDFHYKNSLFETIYLASELNIDGLLTDIQFYNNFVTNLPGMPTNIWVGETTQTDLSAGWIPSTQLTQVFSGNVNYPVGQNDISVHFDPPYPYGGGNLAVMVERPMDTQYYSSSDVFRTQFGAVSNRTRNVYSDNIDYDPANPPPTTSPTAYFPMTTLLVITEGLGAINGTVYGPGNVPLAGATVVVQGTTLSYTTGADGTFTFPYVYQGTQQVTASKHGYYDATNTVTVIEDQTVTTNFTLTPLPQVTVTGRIVGSDQPTVGLADATISLSGYESYEATTNNNGQFTIPNVYANHTYDYVASAMGYQNATGQVVVGSTNVNTGDIVLTELTYPPSGVQATEVNQNLVNLTWMAPTPDAVGEWLHYDNGQNHTSIGTGAAADFDVAIRFPASALQDYVGMSLYAVKAWPAQAGSFSIRVWTGGNASAPGPMVVDQPFTPTLGTYNTVMLNNPVAITGTEELWFGYRCNVTGGYPAGCDSGPAVDGFGNMMYFQGSWTTTLEQNPDLNYNWNIQGYVGYSAPDRALEISLSLPHSLVLSTVGMRSVTTGILTTNPDNAKLHPESKANNGFDIQLSSDKETNQHRYDSIGNIKVRQEHNSYDVKDNRALSGYKVWRLLQGQEINESAWTLLTTDVITATAYQDNGWGSVPDGMYKWAVKAVYTGNIMSNPAFSNALPKLTQIGTIAGTVKNQQNAPIMGATVTCGDVTATTDNSGAYSMQVPAGTHSVTASATGYDSVTQDNVIVVTGQTTTVNFILPPSSTIIILEDSFETYENFALTFAPWTCVDVDLSATYGISGVSFPNCYAPMAYIIFVPSATTPPLTATDVTHTGTKIAASFAATSPPNNDWLITPVLHRPTQITFWARSYVTDYGMERFKVGVSTTGTNPSNFTIISGPNYIEAPAVWTEYTYVIDGQPENAYIGIQCVSNDAFIFLLDDVTVEATPLEDPTVPVLATELQGNYPNPFNPETTIRYSVKETVPVTIEVYNLKGQLVRTLVNEVKTAGNYSVAWNGRDSHNQPVSSGVYFYKMNAGKYSSTKKMIMMK